MADRLVFTPPDPNTPGFLKRAREVYGFQAAIRSNTATGETIENLVEFLLEFVTEPADRDEARETLWDASYSQFEAMLNSVSGIGDGEGND